MKKLSQKIGGVGLLFAPLTALGSTSTLQNANDVISLIAKVGNWMYSGLLGLAVVFVIVAAYNFMFSGGSEENVSKAKNQLLYTLIAVAVAFLSKGIISLLETLLSN